jgi:hypothetical protein
MEYVSRNKIVCVDITVFLVHQQYFNKKSKNKLWVINS